MGFKVKDPLHNILVTEVLEYTVQGDALVRCGLRQIDEFVYQREVQWDIAPDQKLFDDDWICDG